MTGRHVAPAGYSPSPAALTRLRRWACSPHGRQLGRLVRLMAAYLAASGVVTAVIAGTATRATLSAAAAGLAEVVYRYLVPPAAPPTPPVPSVR